MMTSSVIIAFLQNFMQLFNNQIQVRFYLALGTLIDMPVKLAAQFQLEILVESLMVPGLFSSIGSGTPESNTYSRI